MRGDFRLMRLLIQPWYKNIHRKHQNRSQNDVVCFCGGWFDSWESPFPPHHLWSLLCPHFNSAQECAAGRKRNCGRHNQLVEGLHRENTEQVLKGKMDKGTGAHACVCVCVSRAWWDQTSVIESPADCERKHTSGRVTQEGAERGG